MCGKCVVKNCKREKGDTFHRIPKDADQRNIWLDLLDLPQSVNGRVCSKHFERSDFEVKSDGSVWLKKYAYPMHVDNELLEFANEVEIDEDVLMHDASNEVRLDVNSIYKDHNYTKLLKPKNSKRVQLSYNNRCLVMSLRRSLKRTRDQVKKMAKTHKNEMKKFTHFSKLSEFLQEFVLLLMKHHKEKSSPKQYSAEMRKFALSLHYYSPAGYRFVRSTFNGCLPHPQTIASWYRVIDGSPGFTVESLDALVDLQKRTPYQIVVSLVLDGMSVRKHLQRMGSRTIGYTDCGGVLPEVDEKHQLAKEALIYLVVGVNVPFKLQIGYFLINSLTGKQLAYLTETGVTLVMNCKIVVASITHDGLKSQFLMDELLGCDFSNVQQLVTFFKVNGHLIFVFPDMCHMIKLARNFICDEYEFLDGNGRVISWKYFVNLLKLQTNLGLHIANKVRNLHVNYRNQIMKVYLATQLFSASVADAIEFCDETLKLPDFKYSQGTVEFVRVINDLFDIFNSRQMTDGFYKQPLHKQNYTFIMNRLDYIKKYLLSLKDLNGKAVYAGPRYTFVVGMLVLIESLKGYYNEFVVKQKLLTFIPTYKQSQDSVEIFNCCMRSFGGYNSNPTAATFQNAYKKSLLHVQFQEKFSGNCIPLENIPILNCTSTKRSVHTDVHISDEEFENSIENALMFRSFRVNFEAYHNVIAHIGGYIARRLYSMLKCTTCSNSVIYLLTEEELSHREDDEDHGYDDVIEDVDMGMNGGYETNSHINSSAFSNNDYDHIYNNAEFNVSETMKGVFFKFNDNTHHDSDYGESDSVINNEETDSVIDDEEIHSVIDEDEAEGTHEDIDLSQAAEIAKKYYDLIKQKDRGGLFYPSDSLYRIVILADIVFTTALKDSGKKMLKKSFTLNRLVGFALSLCDKYSDVLFRELKEHFELESSHENALLRNIVKFYLKIRIDFLNKNVSANSGKRQKVLHSLHFQGM